jgi:hypothetical protein
MLTHRIAIAAVATAAALFPASASAKTETLRFFSETKALVLTHADGTVVDRPPYPDTVAGDTLDIYAVDYAGTHRRHTKRPTASEHVRCVFGTSPEPDCESHVALGGSLMIFRGNPATLVAGTNRYAGASGRVLSSKEVPGGSDIVARIRLR